MTIDLVYFVNPMCSWCYGFHTVFEAALAERRDGFVVNLALGALREDTEPLRDEQKMYLREAWSRVGQASGRRFEPGVLDRTDFIYDTRPPSRAVAAVRSTTPAHAFGYLGALQNAFYRDNRNITAADVLVDLAAAQGLDPTPVEAALNDPSTLEALQIEHREVAQLGVTGYPTVIALADGRARLVTRGFQPQAELERILDSLAAAEAA